MIVTKIQILLQPILTISITMTTIDITAESVCPDSTASAFPNPHDTLPDMETVSSEYN